MAELHDVTDATFDAEILQPDTLALVDFWGDQCPACRQISPILSDLAESYAGRVKIVAPARSPTSTPHSSTSGTSTTLTARP